MCIKAGIRWHSSLLPLLLHAVNSCFGPPGFSLFHINGIFLADAFGSLFSITVWENYWLRQHGLHGKELLLILAFLFVCVGKSKILSRENIVFVNAIQYSFFALEYTIL